MGKKGKGRTNKLKSKEVVENQIRTAMDIFQCNQDKECNEEISVRCETHMGTKMVSVSRLRVSCLFCKRVLNRNPSK